MENKNIEINEEKVLKIIDMLSGESLDVSSRILASAMVLNYDLRVRSQEQTQGARTE